MATILVHLRCEKCEGEFGIAAQCVRSNKGLAVVTISFDCPYCNMTYWKDDMLKVVGVEGAIQIKSKEVSIGGDLIAGDKVGGDVIHGDKFV